MNHYEHSLHFDTRRYDLLLQMLYQELKENGGFVFV